MFILRKLFNEASGQSSQFNQILGDHYNVVDQLCDAWPPLLTEWDNSEDKIYAFIIHGNGGGVIPLYKTQRNYIMTSDGKTFANLSYKN